jgi:hypothetical protein
MHQPARTDARAIDPGLRASRNNDTPRLPMPIRPGRLGHPSLYSRAAGQQSPGDMSAGPWLARHEFAASSTTGNGSPQRQQGSALEAAAPARACWRRRLVNCRPPLPRRQSGPALTRPVRCLAACRTAPPGRRSSPICQAADRRPSARPDAAEKRPGATAAVDREGRWCSMEKAAGVSPPRWPRLLPRPGIGWPAPCQADRRSDRLTGAPQADRPVRLTTS